MIRLAAFLTLCGAALVLGQGRYQITETTAKGPEKPRLIELTDEAGGLKAAIAPTEGGELSSLQVRFQNRWIETIYRARDYTPVEGFAGRSMVLWPATGSSIIDPAPGAGGKRRRGYILSGQEYEMQGHGFASRMPWTVLSHSEHSNGLHLLLSLSDTAETRRQYPFSWEIRTRYRLHEGALTITYRVGSSVENDGPMPFSIGNHVTFLAPLVPGSDPARMLFESPSTIRYLKRSGLPSGETEPLSYASPTTLDKIPRLTPVSLGGYEGDPYMILSDPQGLSIRVSHSTPSVPPDPVILFNLWGDLQNGFFSPEPWVGLQNSLNLKQGLVQLNPGEHWEWTIRIEPQIRAVR